MEGSRLLNDAHLYDEAAGWRAVRAAGAPPCPRAQPCVLADPASGAVVVFGGWADAPRTQTPAGCPGVNQFVAATEHCRLTDVYVLRVDGVGPAPPPPPQAAPPAPPPARPCRLRRKLRSRRRRTASAAAPRRPPPAAASRAAAAAGARATARLHANAKHGLSTRRSARRTAERRGATAVSLERQTNRASFVVDKTHASPTHGVRSNAACSPSCADCADCRQCARNRSRSGASGVMTSPPAHSVTTRRPVPASPQHRALLLAAAAASAACRQSLGCFCARERCTAAPRRLPPPLAGGAASSVRTAPYRRARRGEAALRGARAARQRRRPQSRCRCWALNAQRRGPPASRSRRETCGGVR